MMDFEVLQAQLNITSMLPGAHVSWSHEEAYSLLAAYQASQALIAEQAAEIERLRAVLGEHNRTLAATINRALRLLETNIRTNTREPKAEHEMVLELRALLQPQPTTRTKKTREDIALALITENGDGGFARDFVSLRDIGNG